MPTIMYANNEDGGFLTEVEVAEGTTIAQFVEQRGLEGAATDWDIQVNRENQTGNYELQPGDRVTVAPIKLAGATDSTEHYDKDGNVVSTEDLATGKILDLRG